MALVPGTSLGPYRILSPIGAGGMGEVYRASDSRLSRDVAIKVLPAGMSTDPDRLRRFELEARAAASLNHPAILAVFDVGTEAGAPYIVSELLDGETLRARLGHTDSSHGPEMGDSPISSRKAVDYAIQIAKGLSAAHSKGIAHRDLKPENLFLTADGHIKILDFGLAKLTERGNAGAVTDTVLPTTPPGTEVGIALGTAGYMAPEQIRGLAVDHRADIFAFGAVLYEMLSGQRAFRGDTPADTMSAILDKEPPELQPATLQISPALSRIVHRCLEKNPAARFQSTQDLAFALEAVSGQSDSSKTRVHAVAVEAQTPPPGGRRREMLAWSLAALLLLAFAASGAVMYNRPTVSVPLRRFSIRPPTGVTISNGLLAVSPDGNRVAYLARRSPTDPQMLWLQSFDAFEGRALAGTENASDLFWSPDGKRLAFFADRKLKTLDIDGGGVQNLGDIADGATGGTWGRDDVILIGAAYGGLTRMSASGGASSTATTLDSQRQEVSHRRPTFLPDGRHFTYAVQPGNHSFLGSLDSAERTELLDADSQVVYASGHLLFARQTSLFAQPFDLDTLTLSGSPVSIAEQILFNVVGPSAAFDVSADGTLAYETGVIRGNAQIPMQLMWLDRSGKVVSTASEVGDYRSIELSRDERRLAEHHHNTDPGGDIWIRDLQRGATTRLTFGGHNTEAIWSPDGTRIIYASNLPATGKPLQDIYSGPFNLFRKRADGGGDVEMMLDSVASGTPTGWKQPTSWSPDENFILFDLIDTKTLHDIWLMPLTGDRKPRPWLQTEFREVSAQISPDSRWVAYQSDETRRNEIYVRPLSGSGKWSISTAGGTYARWRADGKELFYISFADNKLMSVPIRVSGDGIEAGTPVALFDVRVAFATGGTTNRANTPFPYSVTKDGQRFLVSVDVSLPAPPPSMSVVLNWTAALKK